MGLLGGNNCGNSDGGWIWILIIVALAVKAVTVATTAVITTAADYRIPVGVGVSPWK